MKCDELKRKYSDITGPYYGYNEVNEAIAELKDKCQMHDFFWEGCGFAKRGFKNTIAVSEAFDELEAENAELKKKLDDVQATAYAESVDAGMRERRLRRALWIARADRAVMTLDYFALKCKWFKDYMKVEPPGCDVKMVHKWANVEHKCRAKAEEYK